MLWAWDYLLSWRCQVPMILPRSKPRLLAPTRNGTYFRVLWRAMVFLRLLPLSFASLMMLWITSRVYLRTLPVLWVLTLALAAFFFGAAFFAGLAVGFALGLAVASVLGFALWLRLAGAGVLTAVLVEVVVGITISEWLQLLELQTQAVVAALLGETQATALVVQAMS